MKITRLKPDTKRHIQPVEKSSRRIRYKKDDFENSSAAAISKLNEIKKNKELSELETAFLQNDKK